MTTLERVAIVDLGRTTATGARRRVRSLVESMEAVDIEPALVELLPDYRSSALSTTLRLPGAVRSHRFVTETLAWSPEHVRSRLEDLAPDVVLCLTARAYHPQLAGSWRMYIDFVDRLSDSYRDRAAITPSRTRRWGYRRLSSRHRRFEATNHSAVSGAFAAGRADAEALGVPWIPISIDTHLRADSSEISDEPDRDLVFVGTLDYPPNIDAVMRLGEMWPEILASRPGTTALVAGARPTQRITDLANRLGWELMADFDDVRTVLGRARVSVVPLRRASGIQIKVLDAAAFGLPQVVSPVVFEGFDPDLPVVVCADTDDWPGAIAQLLDSPTQAADLADRCRGHVLERYTPEAIGKQLLDTLGDSRT